MGGGKNLLSKSQVLKKIHLYLVSETFFQQNINNPMGFFNSKCISDKKGQKVIIAFLTIITYLIENCKKKVEKFFADDALLWWTPTNCILTFEPLPYIPLNNVLKTFLKVFFEQGNPHLIRTLRLVMYRAVLDIT